VPSSENIPKDRNLSKINLTAQAIYQKIARHLKRHLNIDPQQIKCQYPYCNERAVMFIPDFLKINEVKFVCRSHIKDENKYHQDSTDHQLYFEPVEPIDINSQEDIKRIELLSEPKPEIGEKRKAKLKEEFNKDPQLKSKLLSEAEAEERRKKRKPKKDTQAEVLNMIQSLGKDSFEEEEPNPEPEPDPQKTEPEEEEETKPEESERYGILKKYPITLEGREFTPEQIATMSMTQAQKLFDEVLTLQEFKNLKEQTITDLKVEQEGLPEHRRNLDL